MQFISFQFISFALYVPYLNCFTAAQRQSRHNHLRYNQSVYCIEFLQYTVLEVARCLISMSGPLSNTVYLTIQCKPFCLLTDTYGTLKRLVFTL